MNENLKVVAKFGIDLGENVAKALEDGKFSGAEVFGFLPILMSVPGILEKKDAIKSEWAGRTSESMAELNAYIQSEFSLPNPATEAKIEKSLSAIVAILDLVSEFQKPAA